MRSNSILVPEQEAARSETPPRRQNYPDNLRAFIARSARSLTRSEAASSSSGGRSNQRQPPVKGRRFVVMNR